MTPCSKKHLLGHWAKECESVLKSAGEDKEKAIQGILTPAQVMDGTRPPLTLLGMQKCESGIWLPGQAWVTLLW